MKNKGLLTRARVMPLGRHKDPTPAVLPGRVDADRDEEEAISEIAALTNTNGLSPSENSTALSGPGTPVEEDAGEVPSSTDSEEPSGQRETRPETGKNLPPATVQSKVSSQKGGVRYTLHLKIDETVLRSVDRYFSGMDAAQKTSAKQAMMRAFRKVLLEEKPRKARYAPSNPVNFRVDMLVPPGLQAAIMTVEEATVFEAPTPVLTRNISPVFADFVKQALGK